MTSPLTAPPRFDIYALAHKGVRAALTHTLQAAGRLDWTDDADVARVVTAVRELAAYCRDHLQKENDFIHVAMEARRPGSAQATSADHVDHARDIARLEELATMLSHLPGLRREAPAKALYAHLAAFTAHNLEHMQAEEQDNNRVLWETHDDAEIQAIHRALLASLTPEEKRISWRWMLPFMTPGERAALLGQLRDHAPRGAFEAAFALVQPHLTPGDLAKLRLALGIYPVIHDQAGVL